MKFTGKDLEVIYEKLTGVLTIQARFVTEFVGGQPADEKGVRAFVQHHLELTGADAEAAVKRILHEEIGLEDVPSEEGELKKQEAYAVNSLRRDEQGRVWIGNWMIQAAIKQAASRLKIFSDMRGSSGDMKETGRVHAHGFSVLDPSHLERVYMLNEDLSGQPTTYFKAFMGSVNTPQGPKSIYQHAECVAAGSRFAFVFRFLNNNLKEEDMIDVAAMFMAVGLGSARVLGRGRSVIDIGEIDMGVRKGKREKPQPIKPVKPNGVESTKETQQQAQQ